MIQAILSKQHLPSTTFLLVPFVSFLLDEIRLEERGNLEDRQLLDSLQELRREFEAPGGAGTWNSFEVQTALRVRRIAEEEARNPELRDSTSAVSAVAALRHSATISQTRAAERDGSGPVMPTFWDGFSVGVWGQVLDADVPLKAPRFYLNLRAGGFNW